MAVSKSGARMDYWREYFRTANADIFEIIEGAIIVAASDCPKEFRIRRDGIAQTLFSCKLIKCSGCDKQELALPVADEQHDDDDHGHGHGHGGADEDDGEGVKYKTKLTYADGNCSKGSSKVIDASGNDDDDDEEEDDQHHHVELDYNHRAAEALTDEMEQESQMFDDITRIKEIVDNSPNESASVLCNSLRKLQSMNISVQTLKASEIGKSVNFLRKHASSDVRQLSRSLITTWKQLVDEFMRTQQQIDASEATPESMNPSASAVVDEEQGLPSPPMDDLAFLNPHSMPMELSEFFDGVDDYGIPAVSDPRKSRESDKNNGDVEKQKRKQQKPNGSPMVPRNLMKQPSPTISKPSKPPVSNFSPGQLVKPNMDRKRQDDKPTPPSRPVAPQRKPSDEESEKLEATKRKLHENYQQAENAKRQRTIQVMELHDLPKQACAPKSQHMRPGTNNNRYRGRT